MYYYISLISLFLLFVFIFPFATNNYTINNRINIHNTNNKYTQSYSLLEGVSTACRASLLSLRAWETALKWGWSLLFNNMNRALSLVVMKAPDCLSLYYILFIHQNEMVLPFVSVFLIEIGRIILKVYGVPQRQTGGLVGLGMTLHLPTHALHIFCIQYIISDLYYNNLCWCLPFIKEIKTCLLHTDMGLQTSNKNWFDIFFDGLIWLYDFYLSFVAYLGKSSI